MKPIPPHIIGKLRDYQVPAVQNMIESHCYYGTALDASDMGLGKTYSALAVAAALGLKPVVVAKKSAKASWLRAAEHLGSGPITFTNWELVRLGNTPLGQRQTYVSRNGRKYKSFVWTIEPDSMLIFDEIHNAKNPKSLNAEIVIAATMQKLPRHGLSATVANSPLHLYAVGFMLGLHSRKDWYSWLEKHGCNKAQYGFEFNCGMSPGELYYKDFASDKWLPREKGQARLRDLQTVVMSHLHNAIFGTGKGVRITKSSVPGFPRDQIIPQPIDFGDVTTEIGAAYAELESELARTAELRRRLARMTPEERKAASIKLKPEDLPNALALMKKAQVKVESLKIPLVVEHIRDLVEQGFHVVTFVNFTDSLTAICEALQTKCCVHGDQTEAERNKWIDAFQADTEANIVCNSQAGGESISLHDLRGRFPRASLVFPSFWAELMKQCFGRINRNGGLTETVQYIPYAAGTVEEHSLRATQGKLDNLSLLNDADLRCGITVL